MLKKVLIPLGTLAAMTIGFQWWSHNWALTGIIVSALLFHELGHAVLFHYCGLPIKTIFFIPFLGAAVVPEGGVGVFNRLSHQSRALIALAGPFVNLVLLGLGGMLLLVGAEERAGLTMMAINANLLFFNLLPVGFLDGGRFADALFASLNERDDQRVARLVGNVALVVGLAMAILGHFTFFYLAVMWGIDRKAKSDDPIAYRSLLAMNKEVANQLLLVYALMLFMGMAVAGFMPDWSKLWN